jgi:hypothetical protein
MEDGVLEGGGRRGGNGCDAAKATLLGRLPGDDGTEFDAEAGSGIASTAGVVNLCAFSIVTAFLLGDPKKEMASALS